MADPPSTSNGESIDPEGPVDRDRVSPPRLTEKIDHGVPPRLNERVEAAVPERPLATDPAAPRDETPRAVPPEPNELSALPQELKRARLGEYD